MAIRATWNALEAVLVKCGFPLADTEDAPRRCVIRVREIPGNQTLRGAIGGGTIRLVFAVEVLLIYTVGTDKRVERKVAEDAEDVIAAVYGSTSLSNHRFVGATVERDEARGLVTNTLRFEFQDQATL